MEKRGIIHSLSVGMEEIVGCEINICSGCNDLILLILRTCSFYFFLMTIKKYFIQEVGDM